MDANKQNWIDEMIDLEITPKPLRTETVREFCIRHGVAERTYYYQACKRENQEKIIELSLSLAKQSVPEVLQVLADKAKAGDMKAIDTYLDSVVKLAKNIDLQSGGKPITSILNGICNHDSNAKSIETE